MKKDWGWGKVRCRNIIHFEDQAWNIYIPCSHNTQHCTLHIFTVELSCTFFMEISLETLTANSNKKDWGWDKVSCRNVIHFGDQAWNIYISCPQNTQYCTLHIFSAELNCTFFLEISLETLTANSNKNDWGWGKCIVETLFICTQSCLPLKNTRLKSLVSALAKKCVHHHSTISSVSQASCTAI